MDEMTRLCEMREDYRDRSTHWSPHARELLEAAALKETVTDSSSASAQKAPDESYTVDLRGNTEPATSGRAVKVLATVGVAIALVAAFAAGANRNGEPASYASTPTQSTAAPTSASVAPTSAPSKIDDGPRLTPRRNELPVMASTAVLEEQAKSTPMESRERFGLDVPGGIGFAVRPRFGVAFPVFTMDGDLVGIYVSGLGPVDRATYEDPAVDLEDVARQRLGDRYAVEIELRADLNPEAFPR